MRTYEIRLPYALSANLAAAFPEMDAVQLGTATTILSGALHDQVELCALLVRCSDMGLEITEVRRDS